MTFQERNKIECKARRLNLAAGLETKWAGYREQLWLLLTPALLPGHPRSRAQARLSDAQSHSPSMRRTALALCQQGCPDLLEHVITAAEACSTCLSCSNQAKCCAFNIECLFVGPKCTLVIPEHASRLHQCLLAIPVVFGYIGTFLSQVKTHFLKLKPGKACFLQAKCMEGAGHGCRAWLVPLAGCQGE